MFFRQESRRVQGHSLGRQNIQALLSGEDVKEKDQSNSSPLEGVGLPSLKLTWHLKITPWKRRCLLETIIFRCYVSFRECRGGGVFPRMGMAFSYTLLGGGFNYLVGIFRLILGEMIHFERTYCFWMGGTSIT